MVSMVLPIVLLTPSVVLLYQEMMRFVLLVLVLVPLPELVLPVSADMMIRLETPEPVKLTLIELLPVPVCNKIHLLPVSLLELPLLILLVMIVLPILGPLLRLLVIVLQKQHVVTNLPKLVRYVLMIPV